MISLVGWLLLISKLTFAAAPSFRYDLHENSLVVEVLANDLIHFEVGPKEFVRPTIPTSPMVFRKDFKGPSSFQRKGNIFETATLRFEVNPKNLCFSFSDKKTGLTTFCPDNLKAPLKQLSIDPAKIQAVYGLGQYFTQPETMDGNWIGRVWEPGDQGNVMRPMAGGAPSYTQFPIYYALGRNENYALFLDQAYKQRWDFTTNWWKVDTWGDSIRGYFIGGKRLPDLRRRFMDLVGRPPVPPKKVLGLWTSEFGYENWREMDQIAESLRQEGFPLDGMALDLQWYGNKFNEPDKSRMGKLEWDEANFPNPKRKIQDFRAQGIDLMLIEQSYVDKKLPEHKTLESFGLLARDSLNGPATYIQHNPWWGRGGLIDWTNPQAGDFWHDQKRQKLVDMGIHFHWTDLGEPEMYNHWAIYHGIFPGKTRHADIHNVFNLMWLASIDRGYQRNRNRERFYSMSRSGTVGLQRFGAGMWSGDLGANMASLRMHVNARGHMSFSGVDLYSSDIGGFHRQALDGNLDELYTQWFASGAILDTPVRPHVWNLDKTKKTAPNRIGHVPSNLENIRLRYELIPYYYSLLHRAHLLGEPVIAPLVYYYQDDPKARQLGSHLMIGPELLTAIVAKYGELAKDVYLPQGKWIEYRTHDWFESSGEAFAVPTQRNGLFQLPLFARAGAIIPVMETAKLATVFGTTENLGLRVYADEKKSSFDLYEDDGKTRVNSYRVTTISQLRVQSKVDIKIDAARGNYKMGEVRDVWIDLIAQKAVGERVLLNGREIPFMANGKTTRIWIRGKTAPLQIQVILKETQ